MPPPSSPFLAEQLTAVLDGASVGIYVYHLEDPADDRSLRFIYGNPASEQLTGALVRELLGQPIDVCFPMLRDQGFPQRFARVARTGEPDQYEIVYRDDRVIAAAFRGDIRAVPGRCVAVYFENTTQQRQQEEARLAEQREEAERREALVAELTAARADLTARLEQIASQRSLIEQLAVPILRVWDEVIAVPIVGALDADRAATLMQQILADITARSVRFALLDVTGVEVVDSTTADQLARIAGAVRLLGAEAIITGIRPQVAQAIVDIGIDLRAIETRRNLREALRGCIRALSPGRGRAGALAG